MYVIIAGEMTDVDYCEVFGPFDTEAEANSKAEEMERAGRITVNVDDGLEWRAVEVKA